MSTADIEDAIIRSNELAEIIPPKSAPQHNARRIMRKTHLMINAAHLNGAPVRRDTDQHPQTDSQGSQIVDIAALALAPTWVERHRTLHHGQTICERTIQKVCVELQINRGIQLRHQTLKGVAPAQLVSGTDVRERRSSKVFRFEQLADKKITIEHERAKLSGVRSQALDSASSINNIGMGRVGKQLFDVGSPKRHIAFAKDNELCFVSNNASWKQRYTQFP